jgi:hypothetical protein
VVNALYYLIDDRAFIQVRRNIMGSRANHLYPSFIRLVMDMDHLGWMQIPDENDAYAAVLA